MLSLYISSIVGTCTSPPYISSSQCGANGGRSLVTDKHSFRLFILGFLAEIQNASSTFLAEISVSHARILPSHQSRFRHAPRSYAFPEVFLCYLVFCQQDVLEYVLLVFSQLSQCTLRYTSNIQFDRLHRFWRNPQLYHACM